MGNITAIMRVQQILMARINTVLRPYGLSHARLEVLMVLMTRPLGRLPLGKLGSGGFRCTPGRSPAPSIVWKLTVWVRRARHPTDGRGTSGDDHHARGRRIALQAIEDLNSLVLEPFTPERDGGRAIVRVTPRSIRASAGDFHILVGGVGRLVPGGKANEGPMAKTATTKRRDPGDVRRALASWMAPRLGGRTLDSLDVAFPRGTVFRTTPS